MKSWLNASLLHSYLEYVVVCGGWARLVHYYYYSKWFEVILFFYRSLMARRHTAPMIYLYHETGSTDSPFSSSEVSCSLYCLPTCRYYNRFSTSLACRYGWIMNRWILWHLFNRYSPLFHWYFGHKAKNLWLQLWLLCIPSLGEDVTWWFDTWIETGALEATNHIAVLIVMAIASVNSS